jgi:hypothetical protein
LSKLTLLRLQPAHLQQLYADLGKTSKRTAYRAHLMLHRACSMAVLWGWLAVNPAERVVKPRYRAERKEVWTDGQLRAFLAGTADIERALAIGPKYGSSQHNSTADGSRSRAGSNERPAHGHCDAVAFGRHE